MAMPFRDLTDAETDEFLKENFYGILAFSGDKPYAIPMGYFYRKGTLILGLAAPGRKIDCFQKSSKVCFTICKPRWQTPDLKETCISAVVEGELEEVTDRAYYGLDKEIPTMPENLVLLKINVDKMGAKACTMEPCELFAEPWVSAEAYARRLHEP